MATPSSLAAVRQMAKRNERMEASRKRERAADRARTQEIIGYGAAVVSAGVAGYVDGRLDLQFDDQTGDGVKVFGMPIVPLAAIGIGVTGVAVGGKIGSGMKFSALGIACGAAYKKGEEAGTAALEGGD